MSEESNEKKLRFSVVSDGAATSESDAPRIGSLGHALHEAVVRSSQEERRESVDSSRSGVSAEKGEGSPSPQVDSLGRSYATGRRKNAIARVWIKPGGGFVEVNGKNFLQYFRRSTLQAAVRQPFRAAQREERYDVFCTVRGGGFSGQAGAVRYGISRALVFAEPVLRTVLRGAGLLTRDSRVVERKKYGRRKARRGFQFSKR